MKRAAVSLQEEIPVASFANIIKDPAQKLLGCSLGCTLSESCLVQVLVYHGSAPRILTMKSE